MTPPARPRTPGPFSPALPAAILSLLLLPACADPSPGRAFPSRGGDFSSPDDQGATDADYADPTSLIPERLRIHPLTRFTTGEAPDGSEETQLALHLELKDRFGHNIKALGRLYVELDRPRQDGVEDLPDDLGAGQPTDPDGRATDVYWEIDLRDPEDNALMYDDLITRTYLIYLGGLPGWAQLWSEGDPNAAADDFLTLRATFYPTPLNGAPPPPPLRATYRLER